MICHFVFLRRKLGTRCHRPFNLPLGQQSEVRENVREIHTNTSMALENLSNWPWGPSWGSNLLPGLALPHTRFLKVRNFLVQAGTVWAELLLPTVVGSS